MKVWVVVGCLSLSSEDGSGLRVRAKLIPASPRCPFISSVRGKMQSTPGWAPAGLYSVPYPLSPPPSIHFLTANCQDYEEKCCSTRPDATIRVTGQLWSQSKGQPKVHFQSSIVKLHFNFRKKSKS